MAQAVKGLPWLQEGVGNSAWNYTSRPEILNETMEIKYFANPNFTMALHGNTVSFWYKFRDFRGATAVFAPWEALLETRCQTFNATLNVDIPLTCNTKDFQLTPGDLRWIHRVDEGPGEKLIQLCKSSTDGTLRFNNIISQLKCCADAALTALGLQVPTPTSIQSTVTTRAPMTTHSRDVTTDTRKVTKTDTVEVTMTDIRETSRIWPTDMSETSRGRLEGFRVVTSDLSMATSSQLPWDTSDTARATLTKPHRDRRTTTMPTPAPLSWATRRSVVPITTPLPWETRESAVPTPTPLPWETRGRVRPATTLLLWDTAETTPLSWHTMETTPLPLDTTETTTLPWDSRETAPTTSTPQPWESREFMPGVELEERDVGNEALLFMCSLYFVDVPTESRPIPSLDVHDADEVPSMREVVPPGPKVHILGRKLYNILRRSPAIKAGTTYTIKGARESVRDFLPTEEFLSSVQRKGLSADVWLAAYIGNYIGNCLSYLNDVLTRVEIERDRNDITTKLLVKWARISATLGSLAVFQVLFGLAALLYCRRNFEIVDGVSTFSLMFTGFPFQTEERRQEGSAKQGKFVAEGDGFRWVPEVAGEKDIQPA